MKIKKVDDKPMVIHTKQKAKLHTHEPKQACIMFNISEIKSFRKTTDEEKALAMFIDKLLIGRE